MSWLNRVRNALPFVAKRETHPWSGRVLRGDDINEVARPVTNDGDAVAAESARSTSPAGVPISAMPDLL